MIPGLAHVPVPRDPVVAAPASIPSPSSSVWHLGPLPLRAYALCILVGVVIAVWWGDRRYRARGGPGEVVLDVAVLAVPAGVLGARLYHVVSSPQAYFGPGGDLRLIPQVWQGGLGIWGGVAAGAAAAAWMVRRRGLRLAPFADALAPALLVAQAVGRLGNWFNQELFGSPTTLPWGLEIDDAHLPPGYPSGTLFHPTFLYEALWNLAGAVLLVWLGHRLAARGTAAGGRLMWAYLMVYTSGRVWIEMLRIDEAQTVLGLRLNVWTCLVVFVLGAAGLVLTSRRTPSDAVYAVPQAVPREDSGRAAGEGEPAPGDSDVSSAS
ncbi:prolipoprotein diacylglyceryl transferase [Actinomyces sp. 2119]|uniref:prolipoprotein diacylglyceryl transferase n=1 Tax=Actinomyces TaxID=1654 RepID=UPI0037BEA978